MFRLISLTVLLTLIVVLGITFFRVVAPFLLPLFLAGVMAILAQPLFRHFLSRTGQRVRLASGLTTATVVAAILIPLTTAIAIASMQLYVFTRDVTATQKWEAAFGRVGDEQQSPTESLLGWVADLINDVRDTFVFTPPEAVPAGTSPDEPGVADVPAADGDASSGGATAETLAVDTTVAVVRPGEAGPLGPLDSEPPSQEALDALRSPSRVTPADLKQFARAQLREFLVGLGDRSIGIVAGVLASIVSGVVGLLVFTVALYYFFADGTALVASTERLIPVHVDYQRQLLDQFARVVRSVVSATFLAGLGQAVMVTVALGLLGFPHLLTLFALSLLTAMIPMLGTWLIWGPCVVLLFLADRWVAGTFLMVYGAAVVGMADNVIRTYILNTDTKLHPLLALISVLGGLQVMGLWGVFIGPIVASCLHALVKIFNVELVQLSQSQFGSVGPQSPPAESAGVVAGTPSGELHEPAPAGAPGPAGVSGQREAAARTPAASAATPAGTAAGVTPPKPADRRGRKPRR